MLLQYTYKHLTDMMSKDKMKFTDTNSVEDWFPSTPLGQQMELVNIYDDGHYIKLDVRTRGL